MQQSWRAKLLKLPLLPVLDAIDTPLDYFALSLSVIAGL